MAKKVTVRTRKRGKTWSYAFEAGKTAEGKRRTIEAGGYATDEEAYNAGVEAYNSYKHGNAAITSGKITVEDFLARWMENIKMNVKRQSYDSYTSHVRTINKYMGRKILQDLRPRDVDYFYTMLYNEGKSYNTISTKRAVLTAALNYAVYPAELLTFNPASVVKIPQNAPKEVIKRTMIQPEHLQELQQLYPPGHKYYMPSLIAYHTGMRIGEVLGLAWHFVDLKNGIIHVRKQVAYVRGLGNVWTKLKRESSERDIYIDDYLIEELITWKKAQHRIYHTYVADDEKIIKTTIPMKGMFEIELVCTDIKGNTFTQRAASKALSKKGINSHSFRHTHITSLMEVDGVSAKEVSARAGHKNVSTTENIYTKATEKMQRHTKDVFQKIIADKMQTNSLSRQ